MDYSDGGASVTGGIAALSDKDGKVRKQALRYLSSKGLQAQDAVPEVKKVILEDPVEANRAYAIRVLPLIGYVNDDVLPFLKDNLKNETDRKIRRVYAKTINDTKMVSGMIDLMIDGEILPEQSIRINLRADYKYYNGYRKLNMVQENGILPIRIHIANHTNTGIRIRPDSCNLFDLNNNKAKKPHDFLVLEKQKVYLNKAWYTNPKNIPKYLEATAKIEYYFRKNLLEKDDIGPGETSAGYIYFKGPATPGDLDGWEIKVVIEANNNDYSAHYKFKTTQGLD